MDIFKKDSSLVNSGWLWPLLMLFAGYVALQLLDGTLTRIAVGDSSAYLLLVKSIATGHGLTDINIPGSPAHTQYPPGLPLILAPVYYFLGFNFTWMRIEMIAFGLGCVYMTKRFFEREFGSALAMMLALLVATNFYYLFQMREFLSEIPYAFFTLLALYLFKGSDDEDSGARSLWAALIVLVAAYMTRMIGVTLWAAMALYLLLNSFEGGALQPRRLRSSILLSVAAIIPLGLWMLRSSLLDRGVKSYQSIFFQADYYSADSGLVAVGSLAARFIKNLGYYIDAVPLALLSSRDFKGAMPPMALKLFCLIILAVILVGLFTALKRRRGVVELYFIFYFALLLVWPVHGTGDARRYVIPMLPFVYYYLFIGVRAIAGLKGSSKSMGPGGVSLKVPVIVACVIFFAFNLIEIRQLLNPFNGIPRLYTVAAALPAKLVKSYPRLDPEALVIESYAETLPCHVSYLKAAIFLKETTGPGAVVMARKPEVVALITGGYVLRYPYTKDHGAMEAFMRSYGVKYVLLDACYIERGLYLAPFIEARSRDFSVLHDWGEGTMVLGYRGAGLTPP